MWSGIERVRSHFRGAPNSEPDWTKNLHTLRAVYDEANHGYYVDVLESHLASKDRPRNVAIAGAYGSGKSSVLAGLRQRLGSGHGIVEISLASLNQSEETLLEISGEENLTGALQKEIVKRFLYSAKPSTLPRSRFARIGGVRWWRAVGVAAVAATALMGLLFVLSLPTPVTHWSDSWQGAWAQENHAWLGRILDWIALVVILTAGQAFFSSTRLSEIGIGSAKLSLAEKGGDYFDRYLDEIVYFFERSKTQVVIFEDLDRFDDPGIFQALRELNNLLNGAPQLTRTITFVHAVRDSLFERDAGPKGVPAGDPVSGRRSATDSIARIGSDSAASDRAKFFDLVIPLVPFISHEVSADLLVEAFSDVPDERRPSTKLMSLAGKYLTDMRVIHSVRNEYAVFTSELLDKSAVEGLDEGRDQLFAMVLYKHLHLLDFERIRTGESRLDHLIALVSEKTRERLAGLDTEIADLSNDIDRSVAVDRRAQDAGQRLLDACNFLGQVARGAFATQNIALDVGGSFAPEQLSSRAFWEELASTGATNVTITSTRNQTVVVPVSELPRLLGDDHPVTSWLKSANDVSRARLTELRNVRDQLSRASLGERCTNSAFGGPGVSVSDQPSLVDIPAAVDELLGPGIVCDLVRARYVDQNFALFTTKFHGQITSPAARTFLMQHVDRHRSDYRFELTPDDVATVLARTQGEVVNDPSSLNIAIVGNLLDKPELESVIGVLLRQPEQQLQDFVLVYVAEGTNAERFVERLAPVWNGVVDLICTSERISDASRRTLLSVALGALSPSVDYLVSEPAREVLRREFDGLPALTGSLDETRSSALTQLVHRVGHRVSSIVDVPDPLRHALALAGAFEVTRPNLESLTGGSKVGLDALIDVGRPLAAFVLVEIDAYLEAIDLEPPARSLDDSARLDEIVRDAVEHAPAHLVALLARVGDATYEDLAAAPVEAYEGLARTGRFEVSATNVKTYIEERGSVDVALMSLLEDRGTIGVDDETEQSLRVEVATAVINAEPGSVNAKIALAKSLGLEDFLDPATIHLGDAELVAGLIAAGELEDSASTFQAIASCTWDVFESALSVSSAASSFIQDVTFTDERLADIMHRGRVAERVRAAVLEHLPSFLPVVGVKAAPAIANYAVTKGADIPAESLAALASAGAAKPVVNYLYKKHAGFADDALVQVLNAIGTPYDALTTTSGASLSIPFAEQFKPVLERLKAAGLVKSYRKAVLKDSFNVTMN